MRRSRPILSLLVLLVATLPLAGLAMWLDVQSPLRAWAAHNDPEDLIPVLQPAPTIRLDETPRRADGAPLALETATLALG